MHFFWHQNPVHVLQKFFQLLQPFSGFLFIFHKSKQQKELKKLFDAIAALQI
jgi:hypothetical protein